MINHLWQSTLIAAAAGLLTVAFRKHPARVRYWLWFSASCKFLLPFSLLISLGSRVQLAPEAGKIATPAVTLAVEQIAQPFPNALPFVPDSPGTRDWVPVAIFGVWACGFAAIALIRFRAWLRIRAAVRASTPIAIPAAVEIRSSPGLLEPGVVGLWRPILLLPDGIAERLTPPQLEAVLAHELCHIRRRDNLTAAIHMIVEAVFWFHPLVWWIGARLVEERERACDEEVLSLGSAPRDYAEGILNICKLYVESPLTCVSGVTGSDLKKRIEAIMSNRSVIRVNFATRAALTIVGVIALVAPIVVGMLNTPPIRAQSAAVGKPKFEVASIKPNISGDRGNSISTPPGGRFVATNVPVQLLIRAAYGVQDFQILGGPSWIRSSGYDIFAKAESDADPKQLVQLLQSLLEERFNLKLHRETRELPVYALVVSASGFKLAESACTVRDRNIAQPPPVPSQKQNRYCGDMNLRRKGLNQTIDGVGIMIGPLTRTLSQMLGRPVVDGTGLTGKYDIQLEWAPDLAPPNTPGPDDGSKPIPPADTNGPSIFGALREQLGLKLESTKGPAEVLIIDHVERPSEN